MGTYIKGNFRRSIYQSAQGYTIGLFKVSDTNDEKLADYLDRVITFTGYFHELNDMDTYLFYGKLVEHDKYGEQFQVEAYERCKPEEKNSIIEFLTSGLFKGIGEKKAKQIVDTLGKDTLKIILENPDNLILIPGITKKNIDRKYKRIPVHNSNYIHIDRYACIVVGFEYDEPLMHNFNLCRLRSLWYPTLSLKIPVESCTVCAQICIR